MSQLFKRELVFRSRTTARVNCQDLIPPITPTVQSPEVAARPVDFFGQHRYDNKISQPDYSMILPTIFRLKTRNALSPFIVSGLLLLLPAFALLAQLTDTFDKTFRLK